MHEQEPTYTDPKAFGRYLVLESMDILDQLDDCQVTTSEATSPEAVINALYFMHDVEIFQAWSVDFTQEERVFHTPEAFESLNNVYKESADAINFIKTQIWDGNIDVINDLSQLERDYNEDNKQGSEAQSLELRSESKWYQFIEYTKMIASDLKPEDFK
jgi:hypothetical protein